MKLAGIYKITSKSTNKIYIGETLGLIRRFSRHKTDFKYKIHGNIYLQRHVNKHGINDLIFETLEILPPDHKILLEREIYWIAFYDSHNYKKGFNLSPGGLGGSDTQIKYKNFTLVRINDGTIQTFKNISDFEDINNCGESSSRHISDLLLNKRKICLGWTTIDNFNKIEIKRLKKIEWLNRPRKKSILPRYIKDFKIKNILTDEIITGKNILYFCQNNNLCYNSMLRVIRGERKRHKTWVCA